MRRPAIFVASLATAAFVMIPPARADYAVLRSGVRLHISGYQQTGDRMTLMVAGGTAEVSASEVVAIEPEEIFRAATPPTPARFTGPYAKLIHDAAAKHGVDEALIQRVIAEESNFNPRAISRKDALGLMQLLPETAARYSVANVFDPKQNIDGGTRYLKDLLEQYRGNLPLALAAYNAGPDMVERYGGIPPFPETRSYVQRITAKLARVKRQGKRMPIQPTQFGTRNAAHAARNLEADTRIARHPQAGTTAAEAVAAASAEPALDQHRP